MAGLWTKFAGERRFCIVTTEANESIQDVQTRILAVLPRARIHDWMRDRSAAEEILHTVPQPLSEKRRPPD